MQAVASTTNSFGGSTIGPFDMVLRFGLGLVGDECEDESAEEGDAEAGGQQDVARNEGCFECGFGFVVHGLGFEVKRKCVGESHPSVGLE